jgi:autotransporter-associated beta strand protein
MKSIPTVFPLRRLSVLLLLAVGLAARPAQATVPFPFDDSFTGFNGNLGPGGVDTNNWTLGASSSDIVVGGSSLAYPGLVADTHNGEVLVTYNAVTNTQRDVGVQFATPVTGTGNSAYVSFLLRVISPPTITTNGRALVCLQTSTSSFPNNTARLNVLLMTNNTLTVSKSQVTSPTAFFGGTNGTPSSPPLGSTTHLVVARYNIVAGSGGPNNFGDTVDLWVDPDPSTLGAAVAPTPYVYGITTTNADAPSGGIVGASIHINSSTVAITGSWNIDEFRVGTNWAQVTPSTILPDANLSTVTANPNSLVRADGTSTSTITVTVLNALGSPLAGIAASNIVVSSTSGTTVVGPAAATDANGQTTATITSTSVGNKAITVVVNGVTFTQKPTVQFISAAVQELVWNGNLGTSWDTTTLNWQGAVSTTNYNPYDFVMFNDTGVTGNVNLTTQLTPGGLIVSNTAKTYVFSGSGYIDGAMSFTKDGPGTLVLSNSTPNTYSNGTVIVAGTLLMGGVNLLPSYGTLSLSNTAGASLNLNGYSQTVGHLLGGGTTGGNIALGSATLTLTNLTGEYDGVISGSGGLVKDVEGVQELGGANTYTGGTVISNANLAAVNPAGSATGTGNVDIEANGTLRIGNNASGNGYGGTVYAAFVTNNGVLRFDATNNVTFTNTLVGAGKFEQYGGDILYLNSANPLYTGTILISTGAVQISSSLALGNPATNIIINNDALGTACLRLTGNISVPQPLEVQQKSGSLGFSPSILNVSGTNTLAGLLQLSSGGSYWNIGSSAGQLTVSGPVVNFSTPNSAGYRTLSLGGTASGIWNTALSDNSGFCNAALQMVGPGTWTLLGTQAYSGSTTVSGGTLLVAGTIAVGANAGSSTNNYVVVTGGNLGGNGSINVPVTVQPGGAIAPGTSAIGTLTLTSGLTLNGNVLIKVNRSSSPSNDLVAVTGVLTNGGTGTITVTNLGATPLALGNKFKLFSQPVLNGGALNVTGGFTNSSWAWANNLAVDGTITVANAVVAPPVLTAVPSGNAIAFSWTDSSFHLQYQTNTLNVGLATNWVDYPGGATSPVSVTNNPSKPAQFFRLKSP